MMKERAGDNAALLAQAGTWLEMDRGLVAHDIETRKAGMVLVDIHETFVFPAWIVGSSRLRAAMTSYFWKSNAGGVQIFRHRQEQRPAVHPHKRATALKKAGRGQN